MTVLATTRPTLLDVARRLDPDGKIATIAEVLTSYNEVLDDIVWKEGNLPTGHKVSIRSSIPTPTWRLLNQGVVQTKTTTNQIVETCGIMEAYSEIDVDVAKLNGNTNDFRFSEDLGHIQGMNDSFATAFVYGDTSENPEQFVGLAPRYYTLSGSVVDTNVITGGGSGSDNTSVWLIGWSMNTAFGIYPKGSQAGLQVDDLGEQTVYDASNNPFQAYRTHFQWKCGIAIKDWRFVVRICNLDISDMETAGDSSDTSANLLKLMSVALDKLPPDGSVRPVFYCNNRIRAMLRVKLVDKANTFITLNEWETPITGLKRPTLAFQGVPVRRVDKITNAEATIS